MRDSTKWVEVELPNRPDGLRIATPLGRPCQVVAFPRKALSNLRRKTLDPHPLDRQGVYVLRGLPGGTTRPELYVGKAEPRSVGLRLSEHAKDKEKAFWQETYVITTNSRDSRVPVSFVEARLIKLLKEAAKEGRTDVNQRDENVPELTRMEEHAAQDFLDTAIVCLRALGVFEFGTDDTSEDDDHAVGSGGTPSAPKSGSGAPDNAEWVLISKKDDLRAYAREPYPGNFIVLPGSSVQGEVNLKFYEDPDLKMLREYLIEEQFIVASGKQLRFEKEYAFDSRLTAKKIILGHHGQGRSKWKPIGE